MADVAEAIGEDLEPRIVLGDGHVPLIEGAELRLQGDSAMELIVAEQVVDARPDDMRGGVGNTNDVEDIVLMEL